MDEARDIVLISFPFAAGVALAQFCPFPLFHISLAISALLLLMALGGKLNSRVWYAALFCAIGALCGAAGGGPFAALGMTVNGGMAGGAEVTGVGGMTGRALERTDAIIRAIPFPHGSTNELLRALLTGQRDGLSREMVAAFRAAGASHILALSGLHLGIIYLLVSKLLALLGNGRIAAVTRSILIVAVSAFYAFMTGASPSIIRALLFITINEIMRHCPGRRKDPLAVWCCALMIQLAISPWVIRSVGFQLSYLAMLGIFLVYPWLEGFYPRPAKGWSPMRWIWASMAFSLSCQLFTAPLVWLRFRTFPNYFLLTNLLALPLTSLLMFAAVPLLLLGFAGLSPAWLVNITDSLAELLQGCLNIIASM